MGPLGLHLLTKEGTGGEIIRASNRGNFSRLFISLRKAEDVLALYDLRSANLSMSSS